MSKQSNMPQRDSPGVFIVFMQPSPDLPLSRFHDWYNNEHGPARMNLSWIRRGYRFNAVDSEKPQWMASYDVENMIFFDRDEYTSLVENASDNEKEIRKNLLLTLDRLFFRTVYDTASQSTQNANEPAPNRVLLHRSVVSKDSACEDVVKWYSNEHRDEVAKLPGWKRMRVLRLLDSNKFEVVALHEFNQAVSSEQVTNQLEKHSKADGQETRLFSMCYVFADAKSRVEAWDGVGEGQNTFMKLL